MIDAFISSRSIARYILCCVTWLYIHPIPIYSYIINIDRLLHITLGDYMFRHIERAWTNVCARLSCVLIEIAIAYRNPIYTQNISQHFTTLYIRSDLPMRYMIGYTIYESTLKLLYRWGEAAQMFQFLSVTAVWIHAPSFISKILTREQVF